MEAGKEKRTELGTNGAGKSLNWEMGSVGNVRLEMGREFSSREKEGDRAWAVSAQKGNRVYEKGATGPRC